MSVRRQRSDHAVPLSATRCWDDGLNAALAPSRSPRGSPSIRSASAPAPHRSSRRALLCVAPFPPRSIAPLPLRSPLFFRAPPSRPFPPRRASPLSPPRPAAFPPHTLWSKPRSVLTAARPKLDIVHSFRRVSSAFPPLALSSSPAPPSGQPNALLATFCHQLTDVSSFSAFRAFALVSDIPFAPCTPASTVPAVFFSCLSSLPSHLVRGS